MSIKLRVEGDRNVDNFKLATRVHRLVTVLVDAWLRGCSGERGGWMESNGVVGQMIGWISEQLGCWSMVNAAQSPSPPSPFPRSEARGLALRRAG